MKDKNNNSKASNTFYDYIRKNIIEDDEIKVTFDVTFLYLDIPLVITLNVIKNYIKNNDKTLDWKTFSITSIIFIKTLSFL